MNDDLIYSLHSLYKECEKFIDNKIENILECIDDFDIRSSISSILVLYKKYLLELIDDIYILNDFDIVFLYDKMDMLYLKLEDIDTELELHIHITENIMLQLLLQKTVEYELYECSENIRKFIEIKNKNIEIFYE